MIRGATGSPIAIGDMLLVIQMQDAAINSTNTAAHGGGGTRSGVTALNDTGLYEYVVATTGLARDRVHSIVGGSGRRLQQLRDRVRERNGEDLQSSASAQLRRPCPRR